MNGDGAGDADADDRIRKAFEKQQKENGRASLEKSLKTISDRLAEHEQKLADLKANDGYTSSVEREIKTFQRQVRILKTDVGRVKLCKRRKSLTSMLIISNP